ncbi:MAG: VanZ family protein [Bacillota bacterium]
MPRWTRWLAVLVWGALIFYATSSPAYTGEHTGQVLAQTLPAAAPFAVRVLNMVLRKSTHVLVFAALALLVWWALPPGPRRLAAAWGLTALYAATDELHQAFVPGRSAEVTDVLLDAAAALVALVLFRAARRRTA